MFRQCKVVFSLMFILSFSVCAQASDEKRFINLVVFQTDKADFKYDDIFNGNLGAFITHLEKHAHVILASRTSSLKNQDIINLQSDVMRMTKNDNLASGGIDCRFIFTDESDEDSAFYSIGGLCDRQLASSEGTQRNQMVIKRKMLSDPSTLFNTWFKLFEDTKLGIAFYTDID